MPSKTEKARVWAKENFEQLQQTAAPCSVPDLTKALFHLVDTYKGGDSRLFLYSQDDEIFFFNVNSSRIAVKDLVGKVSAGGGLVFSGTFGDGAAQFIPIMGIKAAGKL